MSTNRPKNDQDSEGRASSGKPFDIEPVEDAMPTSGEAVGNARDGYINHWNPIPRLKLLVERLLPPRRPQAS